MIIRLETDFILSDGIFMTLCRFIFLYQFGANCAYRCVAIYITLAPMVGLDIF